MVTIFFIITILIFTFAYKFYGSYLSKIFGLNNSNKTPSHTDYDGIDRIPAHKAILLGHHFSSIAGAGPVVGPIIAALAFGWLPVVIWIIIGAIFIGGVHDFASIIASIRHKAMSIAEISKKYLNNTVYRIFLIFIWLTIIYVLIVFIDLTSSTFVADTGIAISSSFFIILAICFGLLIFKIKFSIVKSSIIFVPLIFLSAIAGKLLPLEGTSIPAILGTPAKTWNLILICYCFIASTTPVWILLQPRDYLSSFLLYATVVGAFFGIMFGNFDFNYPAFVTWSDPVLGSLFPVLFITVACGACSGFHSIIASGTTSKQLNQECDAKPIGYGAMLIEGVIAVIAVIIVITLPSAITSSSKPPLLIYGSGMGKFFATLGIPENYGFSFGLLALSTFILTTLDTATRLGRYITEELFNIKGKKMRYLSTFITLIIPTILVMIDLKDSSGNVIPVWKAIWPVFGASNQLLAGLTLLVIYTWMKKTGKNTKIVFLPVLFMIGVTVLALIQLIMLHGLFGLIGIISAMLFAIAICMIYETFKIHLIK